MKRVTRIDQLRQVVADARQDWRTVGLTPTMGALHEGHLTHVRQLRDAVDLVVVSIFVNPTQFGPDEDLDAYPRDLEGDERKLTGLADVVWAPSVEEVYPEGPPATTVSVAGLTDVLEGAQRPGHFDGVCTVVTKLLNQVQPDVVTFGRKDFQQLAVVKRMIADLDVPVDVLEIRTVREPDGLAMSSRNRYLDDQDRRSALALSRGLARAVQVARSARSDGRPAPVDGLREAVTGTLTAESAVRIDYVEVVEPETLMPPDVRGEDGVGPQDTTQETAAAGPEQLLVAVAAHVGPARLIDNVVVGDIEDEDALLQAVAAR